MRHLKTLYFLTFAAVGALTPYVYLYLQRLGLSGGEIGLIASMRPLATLLGPSLTVALAARLSAGNRALPLTMALAVIPSALLFGTRGFWGLAAALFLLALFQSPSAALLDDATLRRIEGTNQSYGRVRLWGSLGFICTVYIVGVAAETSGFTAVLSGNLVAIALGAGIAFFAARRGELPAVSARAGSGPFWRSLASAIELSRETPAILWVLGAGILARIASFAHTNFFAIYGDQLGMTESVIGAAWVIGVVSEVAIMAAGPGLDKRLDARALFLIGTAAGAIRWAVHAASYSPAVILLVQGLHGLTFGAFHIGAVTLIHQLLPEDRKTEGQSAWASTAGLSGIIGGYAGGAIYDWAGIRVLFALSAALAAVAALMALRVRTPARKAPGLGTGA